MSTPLVSIATITYNSEKYLAETMASVLSQSYSNFEYIIWDGGSVDRTLQIVSSFRDSRIKLCSGKDLGISDAMNQAISISKGEIIGLLHSDDLYLEGAIAKMVSRITTSGSQWAYGAMVYMSQAGESLFVAGQKFSLSKMKRFMILNHPTVFCRRSMYESHGKFDLRYRYAMDYDLGLRFSLIEKPAYEPTLIAKMRLGGVTSSSFRAELNAAREVLTIKGRLLGYFRPQNGLFFLWTVLKIYIRKLVELIPGSASLVGFLRRLANPNFKKLV